MEKHEEIPRKEHLFGLPSFVSDWLVNNVMHNKNRKNIYLVYTLLNILLTSLPCSIALFYYSDDKFNNVYMHIAGIAYVATHLITWAKSFILCMHYATHTPVFKKNSIWGNLNYIMPYGVCSLFGILPGQYYLHHVIMHHKENNICPYDVSSTMQYQRNNRFHMYHYCLRYILAIYFELPYYALVKKNYPRFFECTGSIITTALIYYSLFLYKPIPTLYVFLLPMIIIGYGLMEGNWSQHIFVHPNVKNVSKEELPFAITYSCVQSDNNSYTFNDGYHIEHHAIPGAPWYDLPEKFRLNDYIKYDGIAFKTLDFDGVRNLVYAGDFAKLASYYINHSNKKTEDIIALLQSRLLPIS